MTITTADKTNALREMQYQHYFNSQNAKAYMSSLNNGLGYSLVTQHLITTAVNPTPQKKMTRLTTSGDWTIALNEYNKLVAFDINGKTITAIGSLLSVDGKAWMWHNGKLWTGVLDEVLTEAQAEKQRIVEAENRVVMKYRKKMERLEAKQAKLSEQRHKELAEVRK